MRRHHHAKCISDGADFLHLCDATSPCYVRHGDVHTTFDEHLLEAPARVLILTSRNWQSSRIAHDGQAVKVHRRQGLLVPGDVEFGDATTEANGCRTIECGVDVDHQSNIWSEGVTKRPHASNVIDRIHPEMRLDASISELRE